ncbi:unnamed protein product [Cuscuta epithymum]|uniref:Uncharacterized protein n=1 Tax=Cuscuta epithymum TaxID=186058 RepID=A0AAV0FLR3_9ASTE|nr:unnamed protein product [Cuscuta epithymum]
MDKLDLMRNIHKNLGKKYHREPPEIEVAGQGSGPAWLDLNPPVCVEREDLMRSMSWAEVRTCVCRRICSDSSASLHFVYRQICSDSSASLMASFVIFWNSIPI